MLWPLEQFRLWALQQGQVPKFDDKQYLGECVSLINQYCYRVLDIPAKAWGHAKDWASNATVLNHFDKVSSIQAGDILVYPAKGNNPYGHIEIALGGGQALGQNRLFDKRVRQLGVLGGYIAILRKKGTGNVVNAENIIKGTTMVKVNIDVARCFAYWAGRDGRDGRANGRKGETDADLIKFHVGKDLTWEYVFGWMNSGEMNETIKRIDALYRERDALKKRVATLEAEAKAVKPAEVVAGEAEKKLQDVREAFKTITDVLIIK